jgi:multidrug efflux pump subunit AcrB
MNITFRSPTGSIKTLPIGTFVNVDYTSTVGSVKRKKYKRVITLTSNILSGYTTTTVNQQLKNYIQNFKQKPDNVTISQTGESQQQDETFAFLGQALLITLMLILLILVLQFNSVSKPVIILTEIMFSIIGVCAGLCLYQDGSKYCNDGYRYCWPCRYRGKEWNSCY